MTTNFIKIGEHVIKVVYQFEILFFLKNVLLLNSEPEQIDLVITITNSIDTPFTDYNVQITKKLTKLTYQRSDYLIEVDQEYKEATLYVHNELAMKHALMNRIVLFINYQNWGLLVHSSCVIENGQAHISSGQSGAGKSTAAKLSIT